MRKRVKADDLAAAIMLELSGYNQEVTEHLKEEIRETAEECVKEIKLRAPVCTGKYKRGWKFKIVYETREDIRIMVYNAAKPQLTQLLENGHAKRNGGRVMGIPHIAPAEKNAERRLEEKVKVVVKGE